MHFAFARAHIWQARLLVGGVLFGEFAIVNTQNTGTYGYRRKKRNSDTNLQEQELK